MIPLEKIYALVVKHDFLEKELSTGTIDSKTFAQKSKEYSELGSIITYAREYLKFDNDQKDLEQMLILERIQQIGLPKKLILLETFFRHYQMKILVQLV